jgi:SulP family sulfate permease
VVFRISGAFFFGAAATVGAVLERIADTHHALVIDFRDVPFVDSTAANTIAGLTAKTAKRGVRVVLTGTSPEMRDALTVHGVAAPHVTYHASIEDALADVGPTAPSNTALPR